MNFEKTQSVPKSPPDRYLCLLPVTFHQGFGNFVQVSVNVLYTKPVSVP